MLKSLAAGARPRTLLGELTTLLQTPSSFEGRASPLSKPHHIGAYSASTFAPSALNLTFTPGYFEFPQELGVLE